jgi:flagellar biosynthesis protein FliR
MRLVFFQAEMRLVALAAMADSYNEFTVAYRYYPISFNVNDLFSSFFPSYVSISFPFVDLVDHANQIVIHGT